MCLQTCDVRVAKQLANLNPQVKGLRIFRLLTKFDFGGTFVAFLLSGFASDRPLGSRAA